MQLTFEGKTAIVTGAARGIGFALSRALVDAHAAVVMVDRDPAVQGAAASLKGFSGEAVSVVADVSDSSQVSATIDGAISQFGAVDVLINNAAIDNTALVIEMPVDQWREMLDVNLTSVFLCCSAVLPSMMARKKGRIINIGSNLALKGGERLAHYCAAKAGVHGFTRALALEVAAHGITVNTVAPGPIETEMLYSLPQDWLAAKKAELPIGRFGTVEEIVPIVLLLASDAGSYFVGSTVNVSGGDVMA